MSKIDLDKKFFGMFTKILCSNLKRKIYEHLDMEKEIQEKHGISLKYVLETCSTLREIDENLTSKLFGYRTADNYYKLAASSNVLHNIKAPTLFICALDDPICLKECIPFEHFTKLNSQNPTSIKPNRNISLITTNGGGH